MKKAAIREEVSTALRELGFKSNQYRWNGATLDLIVGGAFRSIRFQAGMPKREVVRQLGRIEGWMEILAERAADTEPTPAPAPVKTTKPAAKTNGSTHAGATP